MKRYCFRVQKVIVKLSVEQLFVLYRDCQRGLRLSKRKEFTNISSLKREIKRLTDSPFYLQATDDIRRSNLKFLLTKSENSFKDINDFFIKLIINEMTKRFKTGKLCQRVKIKS